MDHMLAGRQAPILEYGVVEIQAGGTDPQPRPEGAATFTLPMPRCMFRV
jgi:hypothetical protein